MVARISRVRLASSPDPEVLRVAHEYYQVFAQQGVVTGDMNYLAYQVNEGRPEFLAGGGDLGSLNDELRRKQGHPREPCLIMSLKAHRATQ